MSFDPLPYFWKCTLSTAHLSEFKVETGGGEQSERESCPAAHLGGEEKESRTILKAQKLPPHFFC